MHSVIALESIFTKIEENKLSSGFFLKKKKNLFTTLWLIGITGTACNILEVSALTDVMSLKSSAHFGFGLTLWVKDLEVRCGVME